MAPEPGSPQWGRRQVELLLQIEDATGDTWSAAASVAEGDRASVDVRVAAGPDHTVGHLVVSLCEHLGIAGNSSVRLQRPASLHRRSADQRPSGHLLDPSSRLGEVGLRSGERLVITTGGGPNAAQGDWLARPTDGDIGLRLIVASGPDVGRAVAIGEGVTVGRDWSCELRLTDPTVARRALRAEPLGSAAVIGAATVRPLFGSAVSVDGRSVACISEDGGRVDGDSVAVGPGQVIRVGSTTLRAEAGSAATADAARVAGATQAEGDDRLGEIVVHRLPSRSAALKPVVFAPLGDLPERPEPPRFGLLVALAPVLLGITLAIVYSPRMLLFAAFAPVMAGAAYLEARRRNKARFGQAVERTRERLAVRCAEVDAATATERTTRFVLAPDLAQLHAEAADEPPRVWTRDLSASNDAVSLRVGLGRVLPLVETEPETRGDQDLRGEVADALAGQRYLVDAPVTVDVASAPIVAVVGKPTDGVELAASMVVQSAHLYSPADLVIAAALRRRHPATRWLGWLPHTRSPSSPLPGQHIGTAGDAERVLHELLSVADRRVTNERAGGVEGPRLLVLIDAALGLDPPLVASLLNVAPAARISVLWLADDPDRVPWQTALTIGCRRLIDEQPSIVSSADPATHDQPVEIDRLPHDQAMTMARTLASFRDAQVDDRSGRLPIVASLGDALSVDRIDERWVGERWQRAQRRSLSVPIGVTATGPFVIDLVGHGPHGLIGGTSGSGKSELLTSLVAGLIACHPPTDVNVLFIDYKGGSSSDPFVDAPHTVGCVTNLDAFLARRALASLRAELNRRMALLAGRAKDLAELVERCPADAPPALVIVVDELAALVQDVPEFVAGLVDIAQRGRSLGIHLLLATQRPAGVVNDNILANTNLRIALRMLDGIESTGLIGSSDAASIPTEAKGRAFGRIGTHAPVVFQSAWSAAPSGQRQPGQQRISVRPLIGDDRPTSSPHDKGEPPRNRLEERDRESTQLDDVLAAVTSAAATHLPTFRARRPWHDELPAELTLEAVRSSAVDEPSPSGVVVGLLDEPDQQRQGPAVIDLAGGGLAVFGTGGSGKSTTLRTLALSAALDDGCGRGGDLTVFGLDFGSRDLASVAQLPQCAEIAAGDDLEAVTRIIGLLDRVVRERRSTKGNLAESNPTEGWPTVLLLIDDYGNLATTFEGAGASATLYPWFETLNRVIVDGRQLGIRTALTATRRAVVRAGVLSALTNRIVLGQAEAASYVEFGLPSSLHQEELVPGRGFLNATTQIQIAHTGSGVAMPEVDPAPVNATLWSRALPAELRLGDVTTTTTRDSSHPRESVCTTDDPSTRYSVVLGIADLALPGEVVTVDLGAHNLAVVGDPTSGRSTALGTIAGQLATSGVDVWAIGPTGSPLELLPHLHRHAFGNLEAVAELLCELVAAENGAAKPAPVTGRGPVLLVDDLDLLDRPALERSFGQVCEVGVRWVAATATLRTYSTNPLVQHLRRARSQLWLRPGTPRDIQEITGVAPTVRPGLPMPPGRGVLIVDRRATVLQVAR